MKIVSDREFRNQPGKVRKELQKGELVLTSRGKPYAVMLSLDTPERLDEALELASRIRARMALSQVRERAAAAGPKGMSNADVSEEIAAVRKAREK